MQTLLYGATAYTLIALGVSAVFAFGGFLHLAGPRFLRRAYRRSQYPRRFYRSAGFWMLLAATLLAVPATRLAGAMLGSFLIFSSTVLLLDQRRYLALLLAVPMIAALVPLIIASLRGG